MKKPSALFKIFNPPGDTRLRVNPTTAFPFKCIGQIISTFGPNQVYSGTGMLLDEYHVLTCAHNIFNNQTGKLVKHVTFGCARNGNVYPYGNPIAAADVFIPDDYRMSRPPNPNDPDFNPAEITSYLADYGVIRLAHAVNNGVPLGNYPALMAATNQQLNVALNIIGYPGDKPHTMWGASGPVATPDDPFLLYRMATLNGQSGASVTRQFQNQPNNNWTGIVGIHVAGSTNPAVNTNFAVRVTQEVINAVNAWM